MAWYAHNTSMTLIKIGLTVNWNATTYCNFYSSEDTINHLFLKCHYAKFYIAYQKLCYFYKRKHKTFLHVMLRNILAMIIGSVVATLSPRPNWFRRVVHQNRRLHFFLHFPWTHGLLVCELELELGLFVILNYLV